MHEAKTPFSRLIDAAHAGETILVAKGGKPWARLVPLELQRPRRQELLIDTHALYVSVASGWEIATKVRLGYGLASTNCSTTCPSCSSLRALSRCPSRAPFDRLVAPSALVSIDPTTVVALASLSPVAQKQP